VKKYLRVVRARYKHLVVSMEAFVNISKLTIEEITGTLKSSDDADKEAPPASSNSSAGKLLLTHEEWLEKYKPHSQDGARWFQLRWARQVTRWSWQAAWARRSQELQRVVKLQPGQPWRHVQTLWQERPLGP
jgi:hypothetical protein